MAERCLSLAQTIKVKEYVRRNSGAVIRVLYPVLVGVVRDHWNDQLQRAANDLKQWLRALNPTAASECEIIAPAAAAAAAVPPSSKWGRLAALEGATMTRTRPSAALGTRAKSTVLDAETTQMLAKYKVTSSSISSSSAGVHGLKENVRN